MARKNRKLVQRIISDLMAKRSDLTVEKAYQFVVNMIVHPTELDYDTYEKELKDAGITEAQLRSYFEDNYFKHVNLLISWKITPKQALAVIDNSSMQEIDDFKDNLASWSRRFAEIFSSVMRERINPKEIRKDIINILDGGKSRLLFPYSARENLRTLVNHIGSNLHGVTPSEFFAQISDAQFINHCDRLALSAIESEVEGNLITDILKSAKITPGTIGQSELAPNQIYIQKMQQIYETTFAGKNFSISSAAITPVTPTAITCLPQPSRPVILNAITTLDHPQLGALAFSFVVGAVAIAPVIQFAGQKIFNLFYHRPAKRTVTTSAEELHLLQGNDRAFKA
jgi:hypothetical protein